MMKKSHVTNPRSMGLLHQIYTALDTITSTPTYFFLVAMFYTMDMDHRQIFVDSLKTFGYAGQNSQESYKLWLVDVLRQYDEFKKIGFSL